MKNKLSVASIENFIEVLANPSQLPENKNTFENMYAMRDGVQAKNLTLYLNTMLKLKPTILLLGEAPGYCGCGKTGIPFVDEYHLYKEHTSEDRGSGFGKHIGSGKNYSKLHKDSLIGQEKEASATIIWDGLDEWSTPPLLWNVFPYHPYKNNDCNTNRTPSIKEVSFGWRYVDALMRIFEIPADHVYCLGTTALNALRANMPLVTHYVRHPSHAGKTECMEGLAILANLK